MYILTATYYVVAGELTYVPHVSHSKLTKTPSDEALHIMHEFAGCTVIRGGEISIIIIIILLVRLPQAADHSFSSKQAFASQATSMARRPAYIYLKN